MTIFFTKMTQQGGDGSYQPERVLYVSTGAGFLPHHMSSEKKGPWLVELYKGIKSLLYLGNYTPVI